jgi:hypothetical protein
MGMDMLAGGHYDLAAQASSTITNGEVICQPDETRFGFTNNWGVPVRLMVRNNQIQTYEPIGVEDAL